jgi:hypothetical protein
MTITTSTGSLSRRLVASLWAKWWLPPAILGAVSALACASIAVLYLNPLFWLGMLIDQAGPSWFADQLAFSGHGILFGLAFAGVVAPRAGNSSTWLSLPVAGIATWLAAFNLGYYLISPSTPATVWSYWAYPLCGALGGLLIALLGAFIVPVLRHPLFVAGSPIVGVIAGLVPVDWQHVTPVFDWAWLSLYLIWQCGILLLAAYVTRPAAP